ncbi:MAG: VTT domain-containing protein [Candidatus Nanohaloarchaea archaeon]|nr:VTT domain-containing protein [Candidatus Nanohaloarchaea archaeon]
MNVAVEAAVPAVVEGWLQGYGLLALFLVFVLEGAMLLYVAPSESLVPAAVALMADTPVEVAAIIAVSVVGATIGQTALFLAAQRGGRAAVLEHRLVRVSEDTMHRFEAWFDRWGDMLVPVSNTLPFTRGMATIPAGFADMRPRRFVVLSAAGTLVFETALALIALNVVNAV